MAFNALDGGDHTATFDAPREPIWRGGESA
jgi:hypothetical protein